MAKRPMTMGKALDKIQALRTSANANAEKAKAAVLARAQEKEKGLMAMLTEAEQEAVRKALGEL